ncbi:DUF2971 domain-containing protein [Vagococcus fluvialis]|uniref:DUF2971 domain-containing protein n=1 Tax=Vagococcus fluvialis TaxID=2738 RepID=UPI003B59AC9E
MKFEDYKLMTPKEPVDEKNFDVNKWKNENPVDYLKVIHIIDRAPNLGKKIAFDVVYRALRLYVPNTLYKYYSLTSDEKMNKKKLETLASEQIYLSDAKSLNDPFELKAFFYDNKRLSHYEFLKKYDGKLIDDFSTFGLVTSLTENEVNSMPMWAHYSNNHEGYCISYDMTHEQNLSLTSCTFPVQYTDERIDITSLMIKEVEGILEAMKSAEKNGKRKVSLADSSLVILSSFFSNIKHSSWSYEKEFRCCVGSYGRELPFVEAIPKEIFIGMNCSSDNKTKLISIGRKLNIPIFQMVFDELAPNFNLVPSLLS